MGYIELYNKDILDAVNLGKTVNDFDESKGDYIKVEIFRDNSDNALNVLYSNRLLFKYLETDNYYIGEYHYHPENPDMGFCTKEEHTNQSVTKLRPLLINGESTGLLNSESKYKKQIDIFKDDSGRIYIKPNELLKLVDVPKAKYKLKIHFLRNIKTTLGNFLKTNKNNLIENGNFFAGLEATQTGDLDRSDGKNNFTKIKNPGISPFVLEQNGLPGNIYRIWVTGTEPNSSYVFSCWVAWSDNFDGGLGFIKASNTSMTDELKAINTDLAGSYTKLSWRRTGHYLDLYNFNKLLAMNGPDDRIIATKEIDGLHWYKLYSFIQTSGNTDMESIMLRLGENYKSSSQPLAKRYFTDLRLEKVNNLSDIVISEYISKLKENL